MKKIPLFIFLSFFLISCGDTEEVKNITASPKEYTSTSNKLDSSKEERENNSAKVEKLTNMSGSGKISVEKFREFNKEIDAIYVSSRNLEKELKKYKEANGKFPDSNWQLISTRDLKKMMNIESMSEIQDNFWYQSILWKDGKVWMVAILVWELSEDNPLWMYGASSKEDMFEKVQWKSLYEINRYLYKPWKFSIYFFNGEKM